MPNDCAMLMTQGTDKIEELRDQVRHLKEVIKAMAEADNDSDSYAIQAMAKEALK